MKETPPGAEPRSVQLVSQLLERSRAGDGQALDKLLPFVYDELRRCAQRQLARERGDHTLQATALVHEAFMQLAGQDLDEYESRDHFIALASVAMRRVLVNHAEARRALKRGGGGERVTLFDAPGPFAERGEEVLALDGALERLAERDKEKARLVELRFFGGLSVEESARVLGASVRSTERAWRLARAWLKREVEADLADGDSAADPGADPAADPAADRGLE